jgi:hypothetical protein
MRGANVVYGALGGTMASSVMTVARLAARRAGLIDLMVPQAVEQWLEERHAVPVRDVALRIGVDQLIHLGYGAAWGAAFGPLLRAGRAPLRGAVLLALAQWLTGPAAVLPLLGMARPPRRERPAARATNLAAHVLYAAVTAFVTHELSRQARDPRRRRSRLRWQADVG